jgi:DNA mismatch repair protein MSH5
MPDDIFGDYVLNPQPSGNFSYEAAKSKLVNLELGADDAPDIIFTTPGDDLSGDVGYGQASMGHQGRLMRLGGWIDLDSTLTVCFETLETWSF